jgi:hypothetical protein
MPPSRSPPFLYSGRPLAIGPCSVATNYLTDSRRRNVICSGRITAVLGIIASEEKGGEVKLVQPGTLRAPLDSGFRRGFWMRQVIGASPPLGAPGTSRFSILWGLNPPSRPKYPIRARIGLRFIDPGLSRPACFGRFSREFSGKFVSSPGLPDLRGLC